MKNLFYLVCYGLTGYSIVYYDLWDELAKIGFCVGIGFGLHFIYHLIIELYEDLH